MPMGEQRNSAHLERATRKKDAEQLHGERRMSVRASEHQFTSDRRSRDGPRGDCEDKHANARPATALLDGCFLIANCD